MRFDGILHNFMGKNTTYCAIITKYCCFRLYEMPKFLRKPCKLCKFHDFFVQNYHITAFYSVGFCNCW